MTDSLLVHLTGLVGLAINTYSLTRTSDLALRALIGVGFVVWSLNNWLLAAHSAAVLCLVAATRQGAAVWVTYNPAKWLKHLLFVAFQSIVVLSSVLTWNGLGTFFAGASSTLSTIAMFYLAGPALRLTVAAAYFLWTLTTWWSGAWWGVFANVMLTASALWGYWSLKAKQRIR